MSLGSQIALTLIVITSDMASPFSRDFESTPCNRRYIIVVCRASTNSKPFVSYVWCCSDVSPAEPSEELDHVFSCSIESCKFVLASR
jgi:hypothetical protein